MRHLVPLLLLLALVAPSSSAAVASSSGIAHRPDIEREPDRRSEDDEVPQRLRPDARDGRLGDVGDVGDRAVAATRPMTTLRADAVTTTLRLVADRAVRDPQRNDPASWTMAPLYDGLIDAGLTTGDPRYIASVLRAGRCVAFESGSRLYHADGHAAGRSWLRLYQLMQPKDRALLDPWVADFDRIVADPIEAEWRFGDTPPDGWRTTDRWVWTDALYMSPPMIVVLAQLTGDERYLRFMDAEFRFAYDQLFDPDADLFYRDARYIDDRTPSGAKVLWSRGNAWVYAGLALLLERLPSDWPTRSFYVDLFERMTTAVKDAQQPDGFWYPNLADPEHFGAPETSGTALFVLGMASGIRQGLLAPAATWPVIERGWTAIEEAIDDDGSVRSVQPPASLPKAFDPASRAAYGTGAVLGAASMIVGALDGGKASIDPAALVRRATRLVPTTADLWTLDEDPCR